jgi:UDP-N-acetylmuramate dehydrogenase
MTLARDSRFIAQLRSRVAGSVREAEPLSRYSTYRIGGPATVFLPRDVDDAATGLATAAESGVPVFPLGLGSNVLLPDDGLEALVVRLGKGIDQLDRADGTWRLGAGLPAPLAARRTADAGWAGLHMMVGVPGTVGGGVYMNAGCHGGQWADVVTRVTVLDRLGTLGERQRDQIPFGYRQSGLGDLVVVEAEVRLQPGDPVLLRAEVQRLFDWRQKGTPFNQPCCGSVFRNPDWPDGPPAPDLRTAGQLIEAAGLKGRRVGGAEVSPIHANYFVNHGEGTAADVLTLMRMARAAVAERFEVVLHPEVRILDSLGRVTALTE